MGKNFQILKKGHNRFRELGKGASSCKVRAQPAALPWLHYGLEEKMNLSLNVRAEELALDEIDAEDAAMLRLRVAGS